MNRIKQGWKNSFRWRHRLGQILLPAVMLIGLTGSTLLPENRIDLVVGRFTHGQRFNWVMWEAQAVGTEAGWWLQGCPLPGNEASQKATVLAFITRQDQLDQARRLLRQELAGEPTASSLVVDGLNRQISRLAEEQANAAADVERILAHQVSQVLADQGLTWNGDTWPPVTFRFTDLPTYLIISPRDEIRTERNLHLLPGMPDTGRIAIEQAIESQADVSVLVDNLGGIGSWPTMVTYSVSVQTLSDIVAHEWAHTYLMVKPLGRYYSATKDTTTMNETVASMVGEEIAALTIARFYPELLASADSGLDKKEPEKPSVDEFNLAMRQIRLRVNELLAQGKVDEAETYMETERGNLVSRGYYLRRLNQAYFAFHGSYAAGQSSVDPIGPWMRRLRVESGSLKGFLNRVETMTGLADLLTAVNQAP